MQRLLHDGLEYWRRNSPDALAVAIDDDRSSLTYAQLADWSDGIAEFLAAEGVAAGDRIGLIGANSLAFPACAFGILKAGATIVPFNPQLSDPMLADLLQFADIRLVIADAAQAARIEGLAPEMRVIRKDSLADRRGGAGAHWTPVVGASGNPAMIIFTSGSTGRPKGVMIAHDRQLAKYYELLVAEPSLRAGSRIFMPLAMHSASGTQWGFTLATNLGATCYFTQAFDPDRALQTLVGARITAFMAISMMFDRVARSPDFAAADLSAITFAQGGGMRLAPTTWTSWRDKGVVIRQVYGLTEIGGIGLMASPSEALANPEACGRGMIHTSVRVVRPDGAPAAPGEPGDVLLRSPGLMLGYWREPEKTADACDGEWMRTGDVGVIDPDGSFIFMDRRKDMIGASDAPVSPSEVEIAIAGLGPVVEVAVCGLTDAQGGDTIGAWIYAKEPLSADQVRDHCRSRLAPHKIPQQISIEGAPLPRMLSGKIDRLLLRARAQAGSLAS